MIRTENDCVGCDCCYGCGAKNAEHVYCDKCGDDTGGDFYEYEGGEYCEECWWDEIEHELNLGIFSKADRKEFLDWKYDEEDTYDLKASEFESEKDDLKTACLKEFCKHNYFIKDMQKLI